MTMQSEYEQFNTLLTELRPSSAHISVARWRKILGQKNLKVFTVKELGQIIGMAILRWHDLPTGRVGTVEDVVVAESYRRKGYGTKLVESMIKFAKKQKMAYIDLTSRPERAAANNLYQKLGWQKRETNVYRLTV